MDVSAREAQSVVLLCVAGALTTYLYLLAGLAVRSGQFARHFGDPVTRRGRPVLFWWTVAVLVATGSGALCIVGMAFLSAPPGHG